MGLEFSVLIQDPQRRNLDLRTVISEYKDKATPTVWSSDGTTSIAGLAIQQASIQRQIRSAGLVWDPRRTEDEQKELDQAMQVLQIIRDTTGAAQYIQHVMTHF